jgi:hypothetical protein
MTDTVRVLGRMYDAIEEIRRGVAMTEAIVDAGRKRARPNLDKKGPRASRRSSRLGKQRFAGWQSTGSGVHSRPSPSCTAAS